MVDDDRKEVIEQIKVVSYPPNCVVLPRKDVIEICKFLKYAIELVKELEVAKRKLESLVR